MKHILLIFSILLPVFAIGQQSQENSMSLLFIGDIMGHDTQIAAAYDAPTKSYNYDGVFEKVSGIIKDADFAIANLELTLAGPPYKGYPQFSSPDALAMACQNNGIDVLVTSNNHSCDRGKKGITRTIAVLDSLGIPHTGTFIDKNERANNNLLLLEKNNIKVGILNYTYGTNGLPAPAPTIVNLIDKKQMTLDIEQSQNKNLDKLVVILHWGKEYQSAPSKQQVDMANFLFSKGVDIIIGSHPHVLQPMQYYEKTSNSSERFIAYSLGNFVSNQRTRQRDGGAMVELTLTKTDGETTISDNGYHLTWVNKPKTDKTHFQIVACKDFESSTSEALTEAAMNKMKVFIDDSRALLNKENVGVSEIK